MLFKTKLKESKGLFYLVFLVSIVMSSVTIMLLLYSKHIWDRNHEQFKNKIEVILHNSVYRDYQDFKQMVRQDPAYREYINAPLLKRLMLIYRDSMMLRGNRQFDTPQSRTSEEEMEEDTYSTISSNLAQGNLRDWERRLRKIINQNLILEDIELEYSISFIHKKNLRHFRNVINNIEDPESAKVDHVVAQFLGIKYDVQLSYISVPHVLNHFTPDFLVVLIIFIFTTGSVIFVVYLLFKQQSINQVKTDFISNVSHELKTPVQTISLLLEQIKEKLDASSQPNLSRYVHISTKECNRLTLLIDSILKTMVIDRKSISFSTDIFFLRKVLHETATSFTHQIESYHGTLTIINDISPNLEVMTDRLHLSGVLYNLIENAIKYSGDKPPEITIRLAVSADHILLSVADKGIGISPKDQKNIFEKFSRVESGNKHKTKGYGLGLNYVDQVVKLINGSIKLESTLGKGSTFKIKWPY